MPPAPEPEHPFADLIHALREASGAVEANNVRALDVAAAAEPAETAAVLERRALAQVGAALSRGRAGDAKQLAALADQMRKRAEDERATASTQAEAADFAEREEMAMDLFGKAAYLAGVMVHQPSSAPAAFMMLIKRWREINFGECEEDAEKRAAMVAKAHEHHINGDWEQNTPEDIRAYFEQRWQEMRQRLDR